MKRKLDNQESGNSDGGSANNCDECATTEKSKYRTPNANINAMYCNRRSREKNKLRQWIKQIQSEPDPRLRIMSIRTKREEIESKWRTHYISENPRLKNISPQNAWKELWNMMDQLISEARSEIEAKGLPMEKEFTAYNLATNGTKSPSGVYIPRGDLVNEGYPQSLHQGTPDNALSMSLEPIDHDNASRMNSKRKETVGTKCLSEVSKLISDEMKESSAYEKKIESLEKQAKENKARADRYMEGFLAINMQYKALQAKNQSLAEALAESQTSERKLKEALSMCKKKIAVLNNELADTQIEVVQAKITSGKKRLDSLDSNICRDLIETLGRSNNDLLAENKKLKEEIDALKESAKAADAAAVAVSLEQEEDNMYLLI